MRFLLSHILKIRDIKMFLFFPLLLNILQSYLLINKHKRGRMQRRSKYLKDSSHYGFLRVELVSFSDPLPGHWETSWAVTSSRTWLCVSILLSELRVSWIFFWIHQPGCRIIIVKVLMVFEGAEDRNRGWLLYRLSASRQTGEKGLLKTPPPPPMKSQAQVPASQSSSPLQPHYLHSGLQLILN